MLDKPPRDAVVWRYMDLERFISLLHTRSIHLCRMDKFKDPWEGSWPAPIIESIRNVMLQTASLQNASEDHTILGLTRSLRKANFISCWHESASESAALWDLYSGKSGVAIQSTVGRLVDSIDDPKDFFVGRVKYIDFDTESVPQLNLLLPTFLKRKSFEHEREVRILHWDPPADLGATDHYPVSKSLSADPSALIERLYISPDSPAWLAAALSDVCQKYGLSTQAIRSSLYDPQVY